MRNLFIVNTTFQMLTAYILANTVGKDARNHLVLVNGGFDTWHESQCLSYMSSDQTTWEKTTIMPSWLKTRNKFTEFKQSIRQAQESILQKGEIDQVYLCSDKIIQNQFLVEVSGNSSYIRFDEGAGSYYCPDRHLGSKVWQYVRIAMFRQLGQVNMGMRYNLSGLGYGKAATIDYLYKPELLARPTPGVIKIERADIFDAMEKLTPHITIYPELQSEKTILFLGSPYVEIGLCSFEQEVDVLSKVVEVVENLGFKFLYKPHPSEDRNKVNRYGQRIANLTLFNPIDPIEAIYFRHESIRSVISYASSGLMFCDIFSKRKIKPISLISFYENKVYQKQLTDMFGKSGVEILSSLEDLADILRRD